MQILFRNAEIVDDAARFHINHLGYGVFETFLAKFNTKGKSRILGLEKHLSRLSESCSKLGLVYLGGQEYIELINKSLSGGGFTSGDSVRIRIVVYEKDWFLQLEKFDQENKGIRLKSIQIERALPEIKSCSALACVYSQKMAKSEGFDEALLLDSSGVIRETSWANFFWFDSAGSLYGTADKVLKGVTGEILLELAAKEHRIKLGDFPFDLNKIHAAFTCRSTVGISEVLAIDSKQLTHNYSAIVDLQNMYDKMYLK